jgi:FeoB-associated Cys-rich membrane protein
MWFDWQLILSLMIVAGAAFFVVRTFLRSLLKKSGCGGGCACSGKSPGASADPPLISSESIQVRPARR